MNNIQLKAMKLFDLLDNKPHFLLSEPESYESVCNFISGFEQCLLTFFDSDIITLNQWLVAKENQRFNAGWAFYILQKNDFDSKMAKTMLLQHFELYINEVLEKHLPPS